MANEATAELYRRQSGLTKEKFKTDYEQYLADLATKYGVSNEQLNANLESRGILRSGEAGTARTRLGAAEEAARTTAQSNYDYNVANEDISLAQRLAGLMTDGTGGTGGGSGGGTGGNTGGGGNDTPTPAPMYRSPADPAYDDMRNRGPRTPAPVAAVATPAPVVYGGGTTQGQLPQAPLPTTKPLPDLSGVDWAGLAQMGTPTKTKPVVYSGGKTQGTLPQAALPTKTATIKPPSARNR